MTFKDKVLETVRHIPKGRTMSYQEVARKAGKPGAARAVGNIMSRNKDPKIPCHRVIRSDGKIGGYNGLMGSKYKKLKEEGVI